MQSESWRWPTIILGFIFLLASSFLDNLRGPLLPQITTMLNLQYSQSSSLISVGNFSSMMATLALAFVAHRFASNQIALVALGIGILSCLLSLQVSSQTTLTIFAATLGTSITLMGSMSNIFVIQGSPTARRARVLSALHSLYGLGSLFAALTVALQLRMLWPWQYIFVGCAGILAGAVVIAARTPDSSERSSSTGATFSFSQLFVCVPIVLYVAGEVGCSTWMVAYTIKQHAMPDSTGSMLLSGFFAMIAITRLATVAFCKIGHERKWIQWSLLAASIFFGAGIFVSPYLLPLTGVLGPFFPLYVNSIREAYPSNWQTVALVSFSLMQASMALFHAGMGFAMDELSGQAAYLIPCALLMLSLSSHFWVSKRILALKS